MTEPPRQSAEIPPAFSHYRELFSIHIERILAIESKQPIHAVPLLVAIACETFGRLMGYGKDGGKRVFAKELQWPSNVTKTMAEKIFDVLRNGLAHVYGPYPFILDDDSNQEVWIILTWEKGPHLKPVGVKMKSVHAKLVAVEDGELPGTWLCVDARALWGMLDEALRRLEFRVGTDRALAQRIEDNSLKIRKAGSGGPKGSAAAEWRAFLGPATVEKNRRS